MHSRSTNGPQVFHRRPSWTTLLGRCALTATLFCAGIGPVAAQPPSPSATYRVFLKNGDALPSYGEAAVVADRLIFNLSIGGSDGPLTLQLISLPMPLIDMERTSRYADSMRAAFYAATRGETEYSEMTAELSRDLEHLAKVQDRKLQLLMADQLRLGLVAWPRNHFFYRANDIEKLVGLVGDVINELKVAVGEKTFVLELTAGPPTPRREPLLVAPRLRESITLSLSASSVADIGEERLAILKSAASITPAEDRELAGTVARRLELEMSAERSYAALAADIRKRAQAAETAGNAPAIDRLQTELIGRDQQFGFRRPKTVQDLIEELRIARTSALARKDVLDKYAAVRRRLLDYETAVRPALSALDGLRTVLQYYRELRAVSFERTVAAGERFERLRGNLEGVVPPPEASAIHATLVSALRMAIEATVRRREAAATNSMPTMRAASSAAAGALLLGDRARDDLVNNLCLGSRAANCAPLR
jgi:hypothetical protein